MVTYQDVSGCIRPRTDLNRGTPSRFSLNRKRTIVLKKIKFVASVAGTVLAVSLVATLPTTASAAVNASTATSAAAFGGLDGLVAAAQKEGTLNLIATPRDWADYGDAIDTFSKAFGIKIVSDNPDGSSAQEIAAIQTTKNMDKMPDVVDIGASHVSEAVGLFANYKVTTWDSIPSDWKDPNGNWFGGYAGKLAMSYDASVTPAPTSIASLNNPAYKGMFAIAGDPTSAQQALISVFAVNAAKGGTLTNVKAGVDFFHVLKSAGIFVPVKADATNYAAGAYKISLQWDYNAHGGIAGAAAIGKPQKWVYPTDVNIQGTPYILAINATAPHPAAARLWEEYMLSGVRGKLAKDITTSLTKRGGAYIMRQIMGGQNVYIMGGAHPITEKAMKVKRTNVVPPTDVTIPSSWAKVVAPSVANQEAALTVLKNSWPNI